MGISYNMVTRFFQLGGPVCAISIHLSVYINLQMYIRGSTSYKTLVAILKNIVVTDAH